MGLKIDGEYLNNLRFASNIVQLSNSGEELQEMISDLHSGIIKLFEDEYEEDKDYV